MFAVNELKNHTPQVQFQGTCISETLHTIRADPTPPNGTFCMPPVLHRTIQFVDILKMLLFLQHYVI